MNVHMIIFHIITKPGWHNRFANHYTFGKRLVYYYIYLNFLIIV